jgi:glyoxylase-like metal-dependent hydrolase (beta-lactamase superfamily II)
VAHPTIRIGRVDVTPLCDGSAPLQLEDECPGQDVNWDAERERFPWAFADGESWAWHVHAFLLRGPAAPVVIDTGIGLLGRPPYDVAGRIDAELERVGARPAEIGTVVHTHLHADHAGGACRPDGEPRFPNARHVVHPADWTFFERADDEEDFEGRTAMGELHGRGMVDLDPDDRIVAPGVRTTHSPGHTPGHRSVLLEDDGSRMLFTGDLLHVPPQVAHPEWPSNHDVDAESACASRVALLRRARDGDWGVAVSHFGNPFGSVGSAGWESQPARPDG